MSGFHIDLERCERTLDLPEETATFAALGATLHGRVLTRSFSPRLNTRRDRVNVPTYPLALGIAQDWWTLLHEPERDLPRLRAAFWARHRLDGYTAGFLFPPIALWSAGSAAVSVTLAPPDDPARTAPIEFVESVPDRVVLAREDVEAALSGLVTATLQRPALGPAGANLHTAWERILSSMSDPQERAYCEAAGRLGLDPYDPDGPDLAALSAALPPVLFANLCEASTIDEMPDAVALATAQLPRLRQAPRIPVSAFGSPPLPDMASRAAFEGYEAAKLLRDRLRLGDDPKRAVRHLLGRALEAEPQKPSGSAAVLEGVAERNADEMQSVVLARTKAQLRFRLCRAVYLAWTGSPHGVFGVTVARTRSQQASRSFSAELIAPADFLRERAGNNGLTTDVIDDLARHLDCSPQLVLDQARNHDIGLRGDAASL